MWTQFLLANAHFAIHLFAALVCFGVFWLYFDAWRLAKRSIETIRIGGFLLLSFSFVASALFLETPIAEGVFPDETLTWSYVLLRTAGFVLILISTLIERLESKPSHSVSAIFPFAITSLVLFQLALPVLALLIAFFYFRRAIAGLEVHVKPIGLSFAILGLSELFGLASLYRSSQNPQVYELVAPFGLIWILQLSLLLIAMFILGRWIFKYLLKQFQTQLFMIFSVLILVLFLITTVSFSGLLLKNIEQEARTQLEGNAKMLEYALEAKKQATFSDAQTFAQNTRVVSAIEEKSKTALSELASSYLLAKDSSFLMVLDDQGQVLARGEDKEKTGDSLSDDPLIKRALTGVGVATTDVKEGVIAPVISIRSVVPVLKDTKTIGAIVIGTSIDDAFVDGIKKATGIESSLYGNNTLSATTLLSRDMKTRLTGITEQNDSVREKVLMKGENYAGSSTVGNNKYVAVYLPLKDVDSVPIGMLFVGRPEISVLQTAGRSIELTFLVAAFLIVISFIPSYLIANSIAKQLR